MSKIKLQATDGNGGTISLKGPTTTDGNAEFELTLPANDGSSGQYLKTDGSGALSWSTVSAGTALTGSTNNTICTVTGANAIAGEANLTFDGSQLGVGSSSNYGTIGTAAAFQVQGTNTGSNTSINIVNAATSNASSTCDVNAWQDYRLSTRIISGRENASNWTSSSSAAASYLGFYTNSAGTVAERFRIKSDGNAEITDGNLVIGTSGHGIDFSADAGGGSSGSAGSELLDDYEHGSWTPTYSDGSSYIDTSSSNFQYIKVGNLVNLWGNIRTDGSATGTAGFYVQSLPFSSVNSTSAHFNGTLMGDNGWSEDLSGSNLVCQISSNSANLRLWKNSGNTVGSITLNNIGPNANIMFSISYRCA